MRIVRRISLFIITPLLAFGSLAAILPASKVSAVSGSEFQAGRIIDDHIFYDSSTMSGVDIQRFFESKVPSCDTNGALPSGRGGTRAEWGTANGAPPPYTCLRDYMVDEPAKAPDSLCTGSISPGRKMAAQVVQDVGLACNINPKVLIVLLQKEQGLVTDDWPWPIQYRSATGYGCPDTAPCDAEYYGFFNQVYNAARQFQRYIKQSHLFSYRAGQNNYIQWHPNAGCGGSNVYIQNGPTAALYNYTPYQPNAAALANLYGTGDGCSAYGNRNFWRMYIDWFGSPVGGVCYGGYSGGVKTDVKFRKYNMIPEVPVFQIYSGTGTNCVEAHVWTTYGQSWQAHIASKQSAVSYPDTEVLYGDLDGSGRDYPVLYGLRGTGSNMVEAHIFNKEMNNYIAHTASNQTAIDPANDKIVLADVTGDGKDESILVKMRNTPSGRVELHGWGPGMQSWNFHSVTNLAAIDPADMNVVFGDLDGDGRDDPIVISYRNTGSGRVEFHTWNPGEWSWRSHEASNLTQLNPNDCQVQIADIDGNRRDEAILLCTKNTSTGKIEMHVWNPGMGSWRANSVTNQPTL